MMDRRSFLALLASLPIAASLKTAPERVSVWSPSPGYIQFPARVEHLYSMGDTLYVFTVDSVYAVTDVNAPPVKIHPPSMTFAEWAQTH